MNPDLPDIRDVHSPIEIIPPGLGWLEISLIAIAILSIIGTLIYLYLKQKNPPHVPSPFEIAINELDSIRTLMHPGQDKEYSVAISDIVRKYIESTLKIPITDRTTEEFLKEASTHPALQSNALPFLTEFLQLCDLAKFAAHSFTESNRHDLYVKARQFVEEINNATHIEGTKS